MRIATVTPYDLSIPGGVNRYALDVAGWIRANGHEVDVIGPASGPHRELPAGVTILGRSRQIAAGQTVAPIALDPRLARRIPSLLENGGYDVVHLHEPLMPLLPLLFLRGARRQGIPTVGTFHAAEGEGSLVYRLAGRALTRWTQRLSVTTAVSTTARDAATPVLGGTCQIIPGCSDTSRFLRPRPRPQEMPDDRRNILFVGRGEPRKGLVDLVEAYGRLRTEHDNLRLVVVGPSGPLGPVLRERARAAGWDDVRFVGPVPESALPAYYQAAHLFVAPATGGESFGLVLTEAMAAGVPVIAGDNPGYRAVVRDGVDGLLAPPRDPVALARAIDALLRDDLRRRRFAQAGPRRAAEFSLESIGGRFLALYDSLAPTGSPARRG